MGFTWAEAEKQSPSTTWETPPVAQPAADLVYQSPGSSFAEQTQSSLNPADTIYQYPGTTQNYDSAAPEDFIHQYSPIWNSPPEPGEQASDIIYQPITSTFGSRSRRVAGLRSSHVKAARKQILSEFDDSDHKDLNTIQRELDNLKDAREKKADRSTVHLAEVMASLTAHRRRRASKQQRPVKSQKLASPPTWSVPGELATMVAARGNVINTADSDASENNFQPANDIIYQSHGMVATDYSDLLSSAPVATAVLPGPMLPPPPAVNNVYVYGDLNLGGAGAGEAADGAPSALAAREGPGWAYHGKAEGPARWGMLKEEWGKCGTGKSQSPINVELNLKQDDSLPPLRLVGPTEPYQATLVPPLYDNVLTLKDLKGTMTVGGLEMHLQRLSVHTPSQHLFDGAARDGEIELLFGGEVASSKVGLGVSAFLTLGEKTSPFLSPLVAAARGYVGRFAPDGFGGETFAPALYEGDIRPPVWWDTQALAQGMLGHGSNYANYLTYLGSLMHPPCTEGVTRILLKVPIDISADDYAVLAQIQGKTARPTQPLNGRIIYDTATGRADGFQSPTHNPYPSQPLRPGEAPAAAVAAAAAVDAR